jgi:AraC family transcriptional regulator, arabinose operon regulatory protein
VEPAESYVPVVNRISAGALDEGRGYRTWRRAGTDDWLLFHTTAGLGRLGTDHGDVIARPGQTVMVRPGTRHDYGVEAVQQHWAFVFAHFHPRSEWLPLLDWPEVAPGILRITAAGDVETRILVALQQAAHHSRSSFEWGELLAFNALEQALLWCDTQNPLRGGLDERIIKVLEMIEQRLPFTITVDDMAGVANLSPSRFSHLFRDQVGLAPRAYLEQQRLTAAARLLERTNRPVGSIASEVGFDDPLYFSTRFRRFAGRSPSEYRAAPASGS